MVEPKLIEQAIAILLDATPAGSVVILFGSYARSEPREHSDVDFLVVEPQLPNRRLETVRLRASLRSLRIPVDVLVVSRQAFDAWRDLPNNVIYEAAREGQSYGRAA